MRTRLFLVKKRSHCFSYRLTDKGSSRVASPSLNKAGYMAIPVPDGWAGAEIRVFTLFDSCSRPDGPTDGPTKALIELRVRN